MAVPWAIRKTKVIVLMLCEGGLGNSGNVGNCTYVGFASRNYNTTLLMLKNQKF